ncbi:DNA-formamidopyrimidine glycosylase family protein [Jatrophihabitans endophyticus]|uniref:DNA-formamidopyrimidine glycosylase family protein n=1 Tax=Jatrophihabitans endophyticus TaxID=1206085 RepID=UPI0019F28B2B|nr:DNA-formamidopyrimidine glycosylase family protein [Jatrophihabitans endophyticus]MBE7187335.1 Fpg/Nei family DNA glycosylase [Jatrophihabitans endophyticus]
MPELPEVEALATFLRERAVGRTILRADVAAINAVKTFDPPLTALHGAFVVDAARHGKFLDLVVASEAAGEVLHLITHLSRGGWLHWRESLPPAPPRPGGKGPIAFRLHLAPEFPEGPTAGFDLTEAGTQKRLAVYLVRDPLDVPGIARLGPDAASISRDELARVLLAQRSQLKRALTEQGVIAGIGNAYSDEILHTARLSPFKNTAKLTEDELTRLHAALHSTLDDAIARSVGQKAATLKSEKRSGLQVHARAGLPCPVCGDTVREVSFADRAFQYCPTCQTEGRELADRRLSRLIK